MAKIWNREYFFNDPLVTWFLENKKCVDETVFPGFLVCSCGPNKVQVQEIADYPKGKSLLTIAHSYRSLGLWRKAINSYQKALQKEPDNFEALEGLLITGKITNHEGLIIQSLIQILERKPQDEQFGKLLQTTLNTILVHRPELVEQIILSDNLLQEGSFENGVGFWSEPKDGFQYMLDSTKSFKGQHSLVLEGLNLEYHGGVAIRKEVKANRPYFFAGWFLSQNTDQLKGRFVYWENDGSTALGWQSFEGEIPEWKFFYSIALLPPDQTALNLNPALIEGIGKVWIDELVLIDLVSFFDEFYSNTN